MLNISNNTSTIIETLKHSVPQIRRSGGSKFVKICSIKEHNFVFITLKHFNKHVHQSSFKIKNCKIDLYSTGSIRYIRTDYSQSVLYIYVPVFNIHLHFSSKLNKITTSNYIPYTERQHAFVINVLRLTETKSLLVRSLLNGNSI